MGLFSKGKKEDKVKPDLPSLPELPNKNNLEFPTQPTLPTLPYQEIPGLPEIETNNLPILPETPVPPPKDQQEIKEAVISQSDIPPPEFQKSNFNELKTMTTENPPTGMPPIETIEPTNSATYISTQKPKMNEPVFIRLDKFQTAVETFEEMINKVNEIEKLMKKTKEIRAREEEELNDWEKEIQIIKTRMDFIDKSVFSKLDLH